MLVSGQADMLSDRSEAKGSVVVSMDSRDMGRKRWKGVSEEDRKAEMAKVRANVRLTETERAERARVASIARWAKVRAAKQPDKPVGGTEKRKPRKGGLGKP
jgi:hypothetical protein